MNATCKTCGTSFRNVDRDEDGTPEIPEAVKCAHPECEVYLCQGGCQELSRKCDACEQRFCESHPVFTLDGEHYCGSCFLAMRTAMLEDPGCTLAEIAAYFGEVA